MHPLTSLPARFLIPALLGFATQFPLSGCDVSSTAPVDGPADSTVARLRLDIDDDLRILHGNVWMAMDSIRLGAWIDTVPRVLERASGNSLLEGFIRNGSVASSSFPATASFQGEEFVLDQGPSMYGATTCNERYVRTQGLERALDTTQELETRLAALQTIDAREVSCGSATMAQTASLSVQRARTIRDADGDGRIRNVDAGRSKVASGIRVSNSFSGSADAFEITLSPGIDGDFATSEDNRLFHVSRCSTRGWMPRCIDVLIDDTTNGIGLESDAGETGTIRWIARGVYAADTVLREARVSWGPAGTQILSIQGQVFGRAAGWRIETTVASDTTIWTITGPGDTLTYRFLGRAVQQESARLIDVTRNRILHAGSPWASSRLIWVLPDPRSAADSTGKSRFTLVRQNKDGHGERVVGRASVPSLSREGWMPDGTVIDRYETF